MRLDQSLTARRRRQLAWVAGISAIVALLAVWTFAIDWEWTYYGDDMTHLTRGRDALNQGGALQFLVTAIEPFQLLNESRFRPLYWSFTTLAYQLGPTGIRILALGAYLFAALVLLKVIYRASNGHPSGSFVAWLAALFFANYTLVYGLWVSSIQELWGVALVAAAALQSRIGWQAFWLFAASLMKEPFVFSLLAFGAIQILAKRTRLGVTLIIIAGLELAFVVRGSQLDSQAQSAFALNPWHLWANLETLGQGGAIFLLTALVGVIFFSKHLQFGEKSQTFLILGLAYALALLFWNTGGHYQPPVWYMLSMGFAYTAFSRLNLIDKEPKSKSITQRVLLAGCFAVSILATLQTVRTHVLGWNQMTSEARDWILNSKRPSESVFLYNINEREFNFYLAERLGKPVTQPLITWYPNQDRPEQTLEADYAIVAGLYDLPAELTKCAPIRIWTQGLLVPVKC